MQSAERRYVYAAMRRAGIVERRERRYAGERPMSDERV